MFIEIPGGGRCKSDISNTSPHSKGAPKTLEAMPKPLLWTSSAAGRWSLIAVVNAAHADIRILHAFRYRLSTALILRCHGVRLHYPVNGERFLFVRFKFRFKLAERVESFTKRKQICRRACSLKYSCISRRHDALLAARLRPFLSNKAVSGLESAHAQWYTGKISTSLFGQKKSLCISGVLNKMKQ